MDVVELKREVEYKFAPEPLLAVQALANAYSFEDDEERIGDPPATRDWLIASGLASPEVESARAPIEPWSSSGASSANCWRPTSPASTILRRPGSSPRSRWSIRYTCVRASTAGSGWI